MKILLWILLFAAAISAQYHVGVSVGGSRNIGLSKPTFGANFGITKTVHKWNVDADFDIYSLCKMDGGCGQQFDIRGVVGKGHIQGGMVQSHYSVARYSKSSTQVLIGTRFGNEAYVFEVNYRRDLTSSNKVNFNESRMSIYESHHFYMRTSGAVSLFTSGGKSYRGFSGGVVFGVHF